MFMSLKGIFKFKKVSRVNEATAFIFNKSES